MRIIGLLAANGLGEAATGKDMFGNQLTEEQSQNGLLMALGIAVWQVRRRSQIK
jgi:hypothetical protein